MDLNALQEPIQEFILYLTMICGPAAAGSTTMSAPQTETDRYCDFFLNGAVVGGGVLRYEQDSRQRHKFISFGIPQS